MAKTNVTSIDARGLACPIPVVKTRDALAVLVSGHKLEVLVDEAVARENVSRFLRSNKLQPKVEAHGDGWRVTVGK